MTATTHVRVLMVPDARSEGKAIMHLRPLFTWRSAICDAEPVTQ